MHLKAHYRCNTGASLRHPCSGGNSRLSHLFRVWGAVISCVPDLRRLNLFQTLRDGFNLTLLLLCVAQ
jgi:hypothetical protein